MSNLEEPHPRDHPTPSASPPPQAALQSTLPLPLPPPPSASPPRYLRTSILHPTPQPPGANLMPPFQDLSDDPNFYTSFTGLCPSPSPTLFPSSLQSSPQMARGSLFTVGSPRPPADILSFLSGKTPSNVGSSLMVDTNQPFGQDVGAGRMNQFSPRTTLANVEEELKNQQQQLQFLQEKLKFHNGGGVGVGVAEIEPYQPNLHHLSIQVQGVPSTGQLLLQPDSPGTNLSTFHDQFLKQEPLTMADVIPPPTPTSDVEVDEDEGDEEDEPLKVEEEDLPPVVPNKPSTPPSTRRSGRKTHPIIKKEEVEDEEYMDEEDHEDEDDEDEVVPPPRIKATPNSSRKNSVVDTGTPTRQKRGQGVSCHSCKTSKDNADLFFCTNKGGCEAKKRRCRKKYCEICLKRSYQPCLPTPSTNLANWICPSCLCLCLCANCMRRDKGADAIIPHKKRNSAISSDLLPIAMSRVASSMSLDSGVGGGGSQRGSGTPESTADERQPRQGSLSSPHSFGTAAPSPSLAGQKRKHQQVQDVNAAAAAAAATSRDESSSPIEEIRGLTNTTYSTPQRLTHSSSSNRSPLPSSRQSPAVKLTYASPMPRAFSQSQESSSSTSSHCMTPNTPFQNMTLMNAEGNSAHTPPLKRYLDFNSPTSGQQFQSFSLSSPAHQAELLQMHQPIQSATQNQQYQQYQQHQQQQQMSRVMSAGNSSQQTKQHLMQFMNDQQAYNQQPQNFPSVMSYSGHSNQNINMVDGNARHLGFGTPISPSSGNSNGSGGGMDQHQQQQKYNPDQNRDWQRLSQKILNATMQEQVRQQRNLQKMSGNGHSSSMNHLSVDDAYSQPSFAIDIDGSRRSKQSRMGESASCHVSPMVAPHPSSETPQPPNTFLGLPASLMHRRYSEGNMNIPPQFPSQVSCGAPQPMEGMQVIQQRIPQPDRMAQLERIQQQQQGGGMNNMSLIDPQHDLISSSTDSTEWQDHTSQHQSMMMTEQVTQQQQLFQQQHQLQQQQQQQQYQQKQMMMPNYIPRQRNRSHSEPANLIEEEMMNFKQPMNPGQQQQHSYTPQLHGSQPIHHVNHLSLSVLVPHGVMNPRVNPNPSVGLYAPQPTNSPTGSSRTTQSFNQFSANGSLPDSSSPSTSGPLHPSPPSANGIGTDYLATNTNPNTNTSRSMNDQPLTINIFNHSTGMNQQQSQMNQQMNQYNNGGGGETYSQGQNYPMNTVNQGGGVNGFLNSMNGNNPFPTSSTSAFLTPSGNGNSSCNPSSNFQTSPLMGHNSLFAPNNNGHQQTGGGSAFPTAIAPAPSPLATENELMQLNEIINFPS